MSAAESEPALLRARGLTLRYPGTARPSLRDVSLEVQAGTAGVLLGAEEAGRTSLLHALAGLAPDLSGGSLAGEVHLSAPGIERARATTDLATWSYDVAVVLDDTHAQRTGARGTVLEEVAFGLECRGVPRPDMRRRTEEALAALGLTPLAGRDPDTLSGGQGARLALAAAWAQEPRLLLLDETDAPLDAAGRARLRWLLAAQARRGGSTLWAPARVEALDEGALLAEGRSGDSTGAAEPEQLPGWLLHRGRVALHAPLARLWPRIRPEEHGLLAPARVRASAVRSAQGHDPSPEGSAGLEQAGAGAIAGPAIDPESLRLERRSGLDLREVSVTYPAGIVALREVSLAAEPGQVVALTGANGGGKTTLLRALVGLAPLRSGEILVDGHDLRDAPVSARARLIGLALQRPTDQLFASSVERDVGFGPRNLGLSKVTRVAAVSEALRACGLQAAARRHPLDLGRGGRRRTALAGVLAMCTPIVALDEPDHGLDDRGRAWLHALLTALREAGRTVLVVSHDLDLVGAVADRVAVLAAGELRAFGAAQDVLRDEGLLRGAGLTPAPAVLLGRRARIEPPPVHADALLAALRGVERSTRGPA